MSDNVQIVLIIALAVVILGGVAIYVLKDKFRTGKFRADKNGVEASMETHTPPTTRISGNRITGDTNKLTAHDGGQIDQNEIEGNRNQLNGGKN